MLSLISLIVVVSFSMLITKIASVMLIHTGLSDQAARFQARSAFTGVGFTTSEAESVVNHPVRRRIIMSLMLIGNAGIITVMATLILTFVGTEKGGFSWPVKLALLLGSIAVLWLVSSSQAVDKALDKIISKALAKYTHINVRDYNTLLHLSGGFSITELKIGEEDWLLGKKLKDARLRDEGINVLGIQRQDSTFLGVLTAETEIELGDTLLIYGKKDVLKRLDERKNDFFGDLEHAEKAQEHQEEKKIEKEKEKERKKEKEEL